MRDPREQRDRSDSGSPRDFRRQGQQDRWRSRGAENSPRSSRSSTPEDRYQKRDRDRANKTAGEVVVQRTVLVAAEVALLKIGIKRGTETGPTRPLAKSWCREQSS